MEADKNTETTPLARPAMDDGPAARLSSRSKMLIKAALVGGALILLVVILVLIFRSSELTCELDPVEPIVGPLPIKNIPSADRRSLASFKGYLRYQPDPSDGPEVWTYMRLRHESTETAGIGLILIDAGCAKIKIFTTEDNGKTDLYQFGVELSHPQFGLRSCTAAASYLYDKSLHFSCYKELVFLCEAYWNQGNSQTLVELHVNALEFEQDGWPYMVAAGQYSTPAFRC